jgi:hypothetical protein
MSHAEVVTREIKTRGLRYGEMLMGAIRGDQLEAEVWSTFTLNDCPEDLWNAIDPQEAAALHGSDIAVKNGPRVWLMDEISKVQESGVPSDGVFGDLPMRKIATLRLSIESIGTPSFAERFVERKTIFRWEAGRTIHQLINPTGERYTLQAFCLSVDPNLTEASLDDLGGRLKLPEGWAFEVVTLVEPFQIDTVERPAVVIQDEFQNTYSK